jgi:hypothetical protein
MSRIDGQRTGAHSRTMIKRMVLCLTMLFVLAACEEEPTRENVGPTNLKENVPPTGETFAGEYCSLIRNRAPFTITGRMQMKTRERASFRVAKGRTERVCLEGESYGGGALSFTITNFLTIPLFHCYTKTDQVIDVFARPSGADSWIYNVTCR